MGTSQKIPHQTSWPLYEHPDFQLGTHETTEELDKTPRDTPNPTARSRLHNHPSTVSGGFLWTHISSTLSPLEVAKAVSLSLQVPP